jgi:hypothetical protein
VTPSIHQGMLPTPQTNFFFNPNMFAPPLTLNLNGTICLITIDGKLLMQRVEQTIWITSGAQKSSHWTLDIHIIKLNITKILNIRYLNHLTYKILPPFFFFFFSTILPPFFYPI